MGGFDKFLLRPWNGGATFLQVCAAVWPGCAVVSGRFQYSCSRLHTHTHASGRLSFTAKTAHVYNTVFVTPWHVCATFGNGCNPTVYVFLYMLPISVFQTKVQYLNSTRHGLNAHYQLYCQTNISRFGQFPFVTSVNCSDYTYSI